MSVSTIDIIFGVLLIILIAWILILCDLGTVVVVCDVINYSKERKKRNGKTPQQKQRRF